METPQYDTAELAYRALVRASALFRHTMDSHFARWGISGAQWGVLRALERAEAEGLAGLRLTDLGRRLWVQPPSMTGIIDRLERSGLVARRAAEDLRAKQVELTPGGRRLLAKVARRHGAQIHAVMGGLEARQQRQLRRLMDTLAAHLESRRGDRSSPKDGQTPPAKRRNA
jgi:DNA-binding MarR family transcriptional regulator